MEVGTALIYLAGEIKNQVRRYNVTPAEVLVLQHVHGEEAVAEVIPTGDVNRPHNAEMDRLKERFPTSSTPREFGQPSLLEVLFPGHKKNLPTKFSDVNVNINPMFDDTPLPKPRRRRKKKEESALDKKVREAAEREAKAKAEAEELDLDTEVDDEEQSEA